jgi:Coenzyme PQQ synthesis protein D (PqqD)
MTPDAVMQSSLRIPKNVVFRAFEAETILLNLDTGMYHGLNETGGRLLELLGETGGRVDSTVDRLAEEYGQPREALAPDVAAFFAALLERGLVEASDAPPA